MLRPWWYVNLHKRVVPEHSGGPSGTLTFTKGWYQNMLRPSWYVNLHKRVVPEHAEALVVRQSSQKGGTGAFWRP